LTRLASGKINEDIAVPRGKIAEIIEFAENLSRDIGVIIPVYGHAGDGNLHVNMIFDVDDTVQVENAYSAVERLLKKVVELNGTISGEHGIGLTKYDYLDLQFSDEKIDFHRRLKKVFDPKNIFNPNKIFPT
jgi:glycolate oxidase